MNKCTECGSYAINHHCHGRDGSDPELCDVCYWRKRATDYDALRSEAEALQVENERLAAALAQPASRCSNCGYLTSHREHLGCLRKEVAELDAATGGQPQASALTEAGLPVHMLIEGLDEITALSRNLRQGGCVSSDLPGLEEGLTHAIDIAAEMLSMLAAAPTQLGVQVERADDVAAAIRNLRCIAKTVLHGEEKAAMRADLEAAAKLLAGRPLMAVSHDQREMQRLRDECEYLTNENIELKMLIKNMRQQFPISTEKKEP